MTIVTSSFHRDATSTALAAVRFNLALIEDFIGGFSFDVFEREWKPRYATLHALEIILEASARLPPDLNDRHPEICWEGIQDAAYEERHQPGSRSASQLWKTASESLPPLLTVIEAELAAADRDNSRRGSINS